MTHEVSQQRKDKAEDTVISVIVCAMEGTPEIRRSLGPVSSMS